MFISSKIKIQNLKKTSDQILDFYVFAIKSIILKEDIPRKNRF